jgi:hypothetical protein
MRHDISMRITQVECVYDEPAHDNNAGNIYITFFCETPLNEIDTCEIISRYFNWVCFEETENDSFIRKEDVCEMRGVIRLDISEVNRKIVTGDVIIPVSEPLMSELISGHYDSEAETDIGKLVERQLADHLM